MKGRRLALALLAAALAAAAAAWVLSAPVALDPAVAEAVSQPGDAAAGRLVFYAGGCESCHMSPGQSDPLRLGGGQPLATPFGVFYPPNISSDRTDGIGGWSARDFAQALLNGVSPAGAHDYPVFPYASYRLTRPQDVRDLFAFLQTLPAVQGRAPAISLGFPFNVRRALGLWKRLYAVDPPDWSAAAPSESWRLGRYLVEGPGHCVECHSPRNALGGISPSARFHGGPLPDGKGKAPALTAAALKDWSRDDIAEALSSGITPSGDSLGGAMSAVVRNMAQLPANYRAAIADYLKDPR